MVIPANCKDVINRARLNECCEPHLEGLPLKQQVHYLQGCCSYMGSTIISLLQLCQSRCAAGRGRTLSPVG